MTGRPTDARVGAGAARTLCCAACGAAPAVGRASAPHSSSPGVLRGSGCPGAWLGGPDSSPTLCGAPIADRAKSLCGCARGVAEDAFNATPAGVSAARRRITERASPLRKTSSSTALPVGPRTSRVSSSGERPATFTPSTCPTRGGGERRRVARLDPQSRAVHDNGRRWPHRLGWKYVRGTTRRRLRGERALNPKP